MHIRRLFAISALGAASLLAASPPASAQDTFAVVCESVHHDIDVNFASGHAVGDGTWNVCVSVTDPSIVRGEVRPTSGSVTGSAANVVVNIPTYTVDFVDAHDDLVRTVVYDGTLSYLGPLPNVMVATMTAISGATLTGGAGTATRTCPTANTCDYSNTFASMGVAY
ncbi:MULTISPECIES: hypothetical protein [unclassified Nonomuraea]|uniref:hypothetical protein n=1 Tax=unclassified Nonomuraea TaxID=2593643 RepID=UPI00340D82F7